MLLVTDLNLCVVILVHVLLMNAGALLVLVCIEIYSES